MILLCNGLIWQRKHFPFCKLMWYWNITNCDSVLPVLAPSRFLFLLWVLIGLLLWSFYFIYRCKCFLFRFTKCNQTLYCLISSRKKHNSQKKHWMNVQSSEAHQLAASLSSLWSKERQWTIRRWLDWLQTQIQSYRSVKDVLAKIAVIWHSYAYRRGVSFRRRNCSDWMIVRLRGLIQKLCAMVLSIQSDSFYLCIYSFNPELIIYYLFTQEYIFFMKEN